jgi:hypothetical protein
MGGQTPWLAAVAPDQVTRPAGTEIVVRQSLTFHYVGAVTHRIYDGVSFSGPGIQIDSTCTVTGA